MPAKHRAPDGYALGAWVSSRRQDARKGRLRAEQIAALDALGFVWDQRAEDFERGLTVLRAFVTNHGHARVTKDHRAEDGFARAGPGGGRYSPSWVPRSAPRYFG